MKKTLSISLFLMATTFFLSSCIVSVNAESGNGKIITENRPTSVSIESIELNGSADVVIEQGSKSSITVETDENLMKNIITELRGNTLHISSTGSISPTKLRIYVLMNKVNSLATNGSGDILAKYKISGEGLRIRTNGSGDILLKSISYNEIDAQTNGSGDIQVSGIVTTADLKTNGSGDMEMSDLKSNKVTAKTQGSGDISINVIDELNASIFGSGDILYIGKPGRVTTTKHGSGDCKNK